MIKNIAEFSQSIIESANQKLESSKRGVDYIAEEQGGAQKVEGNLHEALDAQGRITSLFGISGLTGELRNELFEKSATDVLIDRSAVEGSEQKIDNQATFVRVLFGNNRQVITQLAEIEAKIGLFKQVCGEVEDAERVEKIKGLLSRVKAWEKTLREVSDSLFGDNETRALYIELVSRNRNALINPSEVSIRSVDGTLSTRTKPSYRDRLKSVLENPRSDRFIESATDFKRGEELADELIDEYLETAFTLNTVRVLDRIQKPLSLRARHRKLIACLDGRESDPKYLELIQTAGLAEPFADYQRNIERIKKSGLAYDEEKSQLKQTKEEFKQLCRPHLESLSESGADTDEVIDLIDARQRVAGIQQKKLEIAASEATDLEKRTKLAELDNELQQLIIPIANKVDRLFPHEKSTNLTDVLENEDAICAGKVNVLLAVSKYLGLNARANGVMEIMDNGTSGHVCFECDLPSGDKLVIDSNFSNKAGLENKSDDELADVIRGRNPGIRDDEIAATLNYYRRAITDAEFIPPESRVLLYRLKNTGKVVQSQQEINEVRNTDYQSVRVDPYSGQKQVWSANVPFPHQITSPDRDGYLYINSSFCNNTAQFISPDYADVGRYLFERQIEMSPFEVKAHTGYARLLDTDEAIAYLSGLKQKLPSVYLDGANLVLADYQVRSGNIDAAVAIYEELKTRNLNLYYQEVHKLAKAIANSTDSTSDEHPERMERAKTLLSQVRDENPQAFYRNKDIVDTFYKLHDEDINGQIAILEDYERTSSEHFWTSVDLKLYSSPVRRLISHYESIIRQDPTNRTKLIKLYQLAKEKDPDFYVANASSIARVFGAERPDDSQVQLTTLAEARALNPQIFHSETQNTKALARHLADSDRLEEALGIYLESSMTNPDIYWSDKYDPTYIGLIRLYESAGQIDKAIEVCTEARDKSRVFWKQSYNAGYSKLVELFTESNQLNEAIMLCREAQEKDPDFFNPSVEDSGYIQLSLLYAKSGQIEEAISLLSNGKSQDKQYWISQYNEPTCMHLVDMYTKSGQTNQAIETLNELRNQNPDGYWQSNYFRIVELYESIGEHDKAQALRKELIAAYEGLRESNESSYSMHGYARLAQLYDDGGQSDKFIEIIQEAKKSDSLIPFRFQFRLIDIYLESENRDAAIGIYQELIKTFRDYGRTDRINELVESASQKGIQLDISKN